MPALAQFNCSYFEFNYHLDTALPLSILQCWNQLLTDIRYGINVDIYRNKKKKAHLANLALSTDDMISLVIYILIKSWGFVRCIACSNLSSSLPVHLVLVDAFTPCELSCSVLGYAFGVMETAVNWILKNSAKES